MKILLIAPMPPARDGLATYAAPLLSAYLEEGAEVAVLTTTADAVLPDGVTALGLLSWRSLQTLRSAVTVLRWRPDVVHVQHGIATYGPKLLLLWTMVVLLRVQRVPVVVSHHEVTRDLDRLGLAGVIYYRATALLTSLVHVHTTKSAEAVMNRLGVRRERILVRPHPVYPLQHSDVTPAQVRWRYGLADRHVLLLFGYVHVEKGLREVADGWALLLRRRPDFAARAVLVVAGDVRPRPPSFSRFERADRDYLAQVKATLMAAGVEDSVVFTGHVPDSEVAAWFGASDVVLLPYTATEQSGVANIAVAAGRPVLSSGASGLWELFGSALPTFDSLSPKHVADNIERVVEHGVGERWQERYREIIDGGSPSLLASAVLDLARDARSPKVPAVSTETTP